MPGDIAPGDTTQQPSSALREVEPAAGGLTIRVSSGAGHGATRLAAFDAALLSAGVADFNLVRLSSVIPPHSLVREVDQAEQLPGGHGDLLYCVYADAYASRPAEMAWAGVAWSVREHGPGGGLFVEHTGAARSLVERDLDLSLDALSRGRGGGFVERGRRMESAECVEGHACALVVASYARSGWGSDD
ncbi:MAG TPA: pyruvoyl-dependent arginine decarboxylase [Propionibacteriaceae bacterium]